MAINTHNFINCDRCCSPIEIGQDAYELDGQYLCEDCYDEAESQIKRDARIEVNSDNFELEEQVPDLGK